MNLCKKTYIENEFGQEEAKRNKKLAEFFHAEDAEKYSTENAESQN